MAIFPQPLLKLTTSFQTILDGNKRRSLEHLINANPTPLPNN